MTSEQLETKTRNGVKDNFSTVFPSSISGRRWEIFAKTSNSAVLRVAERIHAFHAQGEARISTSEKEKHNLSITWKVNLKKNKTVSVGAAGIVNLRCFGFS